MNKQDFDMLRVTVRAILEDRNVVTRHWTVQGFGMMRVYFGGDRFRLNVWDNRLTVPNVSLVHDHPWAFRSVNIAGLIANTRFDESRVWSSKALPAQAQGCEGLYHWTNILTGPKGGPVEDDINISYLKPNATEFYAPGDTYSQLAKEVHATHYRPGTVTFNDRTDRNGEKARVFWQAETDWVDAKPRDATLDEIKRTLALALGQFVE